MSDWKFGTVLRRADGGPNVIVMAIGPNGSRFTPTSDGLSPSLSVGAWIGLTIVNASQPMAWGNPGQSTWLLDEGWEVVDD